MDNDIIYKVVVFEPQPYDFLVGYVRSQTDAVEAIKEYCKLVFKTEPKLKQVSANIWEASNIKMNTDYANVYLRFATYHHIIGNVETNDYEIQDLNKFYVAEKEEEPEYPKTYQG